MLLYPTSLSALTIKGNIRYGHCTQHQLSGRLTGSVKLWMPTLTCVKVFEAASTTKTFAIFFTLEYKRFYYAKVRSKLDVASVRRSFPQTHMCDFRA